MLAGGAGRRIGGGKPSRLLFGRPLIAYPLAALREAGLDAVVVAKPGVLLPALDVPVVLDASPTLHPLAGILAALDHAEGPVIVVAADMPFLEPALLRALATADPGAAVVAAEAGGTLEPLCARYSPAVRDALWQALEREAPLRRTLAGLSPATIPTHAGVVVNVNTPEDLEQAERRQPRSSAVANASIPSSKPIVGS